MCFLLRVRLDQDERKEIRGVGRTGDKIHAEDLEMDCAVDYGGYMRSVVDQPRYRT